MHAYAGKSICRESGYCIVKRKACHYAAWIKESQVVFHKIKTKTNRNHSKNSEPEKTAGKGFDIMWVIHQHIEQRKNHRENGCDPGNSMKIAFKITVFF